MIESLLPTRSARAIVGWSIVAAILVLLWVLVDNNYYLRLLISAGIAMIGVIPFGLLMGHMGYMAMGQGGFIGVGAYVVGCLTVQRFEIDIWAALPIAIMVVGALAYAFSFALFRLRGYHFSIGTLALGQLLYLAFDSWEWATGGPHGTSGIPRPAIGEFVFATNSRFLIIVSVFVFLAGFTSWWLARGHVGRALNAIRQDEDLAGARGLDVLRYKQLIFTFAAVWAGLAGGLYGSMQISIDPSSFTIWGSFQYVIYVIIGGAGTLLGPVIGVIFITVLDQLIADVGVWNQMILGALIVITVLFFRGGLWGGIRMLWALALKNRSADRSAVSTQAGAAE
ncbi:MAG: branched-chain amino acid ABC transporter permease [Alphaproteobacteria bacterium]|nr:branched-chain amino acid ABC transporter permease [Alphaproteobacteria bacterium]